MTGMRADAWLQVAGYLTWLVSGIPMLTGMARGTVPMATAAVWGCAFVAFGAAFGASCHVHARGGAAARVALLAIQAGSGLVMAHITTDAIAAGTLVVVAAQLLGVFSVGGAIAWIAVQTALLMASFWTRFGPVSAVTVAGAFAGFETFALATASLAHSERAAREDLSRANAELVAARALLAEDSRVAERLRISRDLHDTIGHHLTALSLQLEVAGRLSSGQAGAHVRHAHAVTRLLLSDVREVVGRLRDTSHVNLADAIRTLAVGAASLEVHLDLPDSLALDDPGQAHALIRCVQEIITNASRHGAARNLWIRIERRDQGIDLHARDDGRGAADLKWGNGLSGMRERFEEQAGHVTFTPGPGRGFEVRGFMPRSGAAS
jgi:signal transduction histidine kinase